MSQFESRLLVEGVRAVEGESPNLSTYCIKSRESSFESVLLKRALMHNKSTEINALFLHFKKLTRNFFMLFAVLLFVCGGFAVNKMLFTEQLTAINFFWAFALFFIPNIFMFLVWLVFFVKPSLIQTSSLRRFSLAAIHFFERHFNHPLSNDKSSKESNKKVHLALFHCYFNIHFGRQLGRYQLAKLTHLLWLSYFAGATLMSILMLATHQVDFVWQTSILSIDSFQSLTQLLAYLPHQLGFPVPSIEQIQQSYLNSSELIDAENRRLAWSSLLISSLLLYGLLPRLLLFLVMFYQFNKKAALYRIDLSTPYYVQLRQLLKPNKTSLGITDVDEQRLTNDSERFVHNQTQPGQLPSHFFPIALELSTRQLNLASNHTQQCNIVSSNELVNVCDHQTQQSLLAELQNNDSQAIVVYVALNRLPDRGLKRFISQLTALPSRAFHLAMIVENNHNKLRESDWYQLANEVGINLDNILHIEAGSKHE